MDLDGVRPVAWDFSQRHDILGVKVLRDESAVRDLDVLCHEVTGPHYTGDVTARNNFVKDHLPAAGGAVHRPGVPGVGARPARPRAADRGPGHGHGPRRRRAARRATGVQRRRAARWAPRRASPERTGRSPPPRRWSAPATQIDIQVIARAGAGGPELDRINFTAFAGSGSVTVGDGNAFLVANAEGDDEVIDSADPNFSDTASAADKDATASSTATTALQLSSGGMEFTGSANISASDDGGGGDASAYVVREFTLTEDLFYHLDATLGGSVFGNTTAGQITLRLASSQSPFFSRTTVGSDSFGGFLGAGTYEIEVEVGCSPDFSGGTCTGNWSFKLEIGDLIGP